jgi:hypothetical protein
VPGARKSDSLIMITTSAVAAVPPGGVALCVVGDQPVDPALAVQVGNQHANAAPRSRHARLGCSECPLEILPSPRLPECVCDREEAGPECQAEHPYHARQ